MFVSWIWLAFQIIQPNSDQDGKMALISRLKIAHPQLKYSNAHLSPLSKTTKKSQSWKAGQGREADETNTLHIKQGYLAKTVTFIFWKQNWWRLPRTAIGSLILKTYCLSPLLITHKRYKFWHPLSIHQLLLPVPGDTFGLKGMFTIIDPTDTLLTIRMDGKTGEVGFKDKLDSIFFINFILQAYHSELRCSNVP